MGPNTTVHPSHTCARASDAVPWRTECSDITTRAEAEQERLSQVRCASAVDMSAVLGVLDSLLMRVQAQSEDGQ